MGLGSMRFFKKEKILNPFFSKKMFFPFFLFFAMGCSVIQKTVGVSPKENPPIANPFVSYQKSPNENVIFRSKTGPKSIELEIPNSQQSRVTEYQVPLTVNQKENFVDLENKITLSDREIAESRPSFSSNDDPKKEAVEGLLGVQSFAQNQESDKESYLMRIDQIKTFFDQSRWEAALKATDLAISYYPNDSKLHQMRGSLLLKLGHPNLAIKAWKEALQFDPNNKSLKNFVTKMEKKNK